MAYFLKHIHDNLWHGKFSIFPEDVAVHAISTRLGGGSKAPYDSLDLALHVGDNAADVCENRRLFAARLGLDADRIVTPEQVHGDDIAVVTETDAGRGAKDYADCIQATDALITNTPNLPLMLCFADCTPIVFLDPERRAAGIAHGGWKGTVASIAEKTLQRMEDAFGTAPKDVLVGIGPAIGPCCYEVGDEVAAKFRTAFPYADECLLKEQDGHIHLDLWEANRQQMLRAGVPEENIQVAGECTCCRHKWYYSYRADGGKTGRIAAMIALKPEV
ncbi:MAG: peptidoglycan editing factor PgeF [Selenomonadaceae bacterium]|nr:peptidoglycan editing factor PgeF [Selenomonadaceae bacterium]